VDNRDPSVLFEIFNEIGIIEQLSRALLEARLPDGLIAPHFGVLSHLSKGRDGATPVEMARAFQVPKTSMTHTLKGLEQGGYVTLKPNPEDGRSKQVWLTEKGRGLRNQTIQALAPDFMDLIGKFDVARLQAIKPVLTDLRITLDEARN
jgi:DNA-binding MarR family transcriptional regulator